MDCPRGTRPPRAQQYNLLQETVEEQHKLANNINTSSASVPSSDHSFSIRQGIQMHGRPLYRIVRWQAQAQTQAQEPARPTVMA